MSDCTVTPSSSLPQLNTSQPRTLAFPSDRNYLPDALPTKPPRIRPVAIGMFWFKFSLLTRLDSGVRVSPLCRPVCNVNFWVSKQFHSITYIPTMWRILYTNAPLPRPPGPFPFQSSRYLEDTLLRSELLAQSWTTRPMQDISSVEIPIDPGKHRGRLRGPKLLCGRWCISCESSRKFVFRDLDSNTAYLVVGCQKWWTSRLRH